MDIIRGGPASKPGPDDWFTGEVRLQEIANGEPPSRLRALRVQFSPGARTAWHSHPIGQVLHVTEGAGLVQSRGGAREEIRAGDSVTAAPGEWHWHGAAPGTFLVHLAVSDGTTEWAEPVTDDEYQA
ncbi:MAG: (R)-mandelonitrile lyase [Streptosporangiaceae bacterium]